MVMCQTPNFNFEKCSMDKDEIQAGKIAINAHSLSGT